MNYRLCLLWCSIIFAGVFLIGCQQDNQEQMAQNHRIETAEDAAEDYIFSNYRGINEITFTEEDINEMGVLVINGYINGMKDEKFSVLYDFGQKYILGAAVPAENK